MRNKTTIRSPLSLHFCHSFDFLFIIISIIIIHRRNQFAISWWSVRLEKTLGRRARPTTTTNDPLVLSSVPRLFFLSLQPFQVEASFAVQDRDGDTLRGPDCVAPVACLTIFSVPPAENGQRDPVGRSLLMETDWPSRSRSKCHHLTGTYRPRKRPDGPPAPSLSIATSRQYSTRRKYF